MLNENLFDVYESGNWRENTLYFQLHTYINVSPIESSITEFISSIYILSTLLKVKYVIRTESNKVNPTSFDVDEYLRGYSI